MLDRLKAALRVYRLMRSIEISVSDSIRAALNQIRR